MLINETETSESNESTESSGDFNLRDAADELLGNETQDGSTSEELTDGQLEKAPTETVSDEQKALDVLNGKVDQTKEEAGNIALLEQINAIGAIHNGQPVKFESMEQMKEIIQKGYDYTKKTMAHAEEVKNFQEQSRQVAETFQQRDQEIHATTVKNSIVDQMVDRMKESDPELYQYIQEAFSREVAEHEKNHAINAKSEGRFKDLEKKFEDMEKGKEQDTLNTVKGNWEKELADVQTNKSARLKQLGIVPDWNKVKAVYAADSSNKMTAEAALLAVYGADMIRANESETSRLKKANAFQASRNGRGGVSSSHKGSESTSFGVGDYASILRA